MAQVVRYFLPPIVKSVTRRAETSSGLIYLLEFIGTGATTAISPTPASSCIRKWRRKAARYWPRCSPIRCICSKIVGNRAKVLPLRPEMLERMLPYVAILALGAIELKTRQPLKAVLLRILNGRADPVAMANPYKALAGEVRRRRVAELGRNKDRRSGLAAVFGTLFARSDAQRAA